MENKIEIEIDKTGILEITKKYLDWHQNFTLKKITLQLNKEECKQLIKKLEAHVKE